MHGILNFLREEPVMAWSVLLALLVTIVPAASLFWRKMFGHGQVEVAKQPVLETKPARFGNQTELIILLAGLLSLLAVIGWIHSTFLDNLASRGMHPNVRKHLGNTLPATLMVVREFFTTLTDCMNCVSMLSNRNNKRKNLVKSQAPPGKTICNGFPC